MSPTTPTTSAACGSRDTTSAACGSRDTTSAACGSRDTTSATRGSRGATRVAPGARATLVRRTRSVARAVLTAVIALGIAAAAACTGGGSPELSPAPRTATVVASTTWVAALAKAAGATDIAVIAPATIPDQASFTPAPAELTPASRAEHVLFAESDGFAAALKSAAGDAHLVPVRPATTLPEIRTQVIGLGEVFGTQQAAARWVAVFEAEVNALSDSLKGLAPIPPLTAVAQADVAHWAAFAGVRVIASYGPGPVGDAEAARLAAKKPNLLLSNVHLPADTPDIPGAARVDLANYPGEDLNLLTVFQTNADRIGAHFAQRAR